MLPWKSSDTPASSDTIDNVDVLQLKEHTTVIPMINDTDDNMHGDVWSNERLETTDEELKELCMYLSKNMILMGCGPEGCSIIDECGKGAMAGVEPYALGSDVHQLEHVCSVRNVSSPYR